MGASRKITRADRFKPVRRSHRVNEGAGREAGAAGEGAVSKELGREEERGGDRLREKRENGGLGKAERQRCRAKAGLRDGVTRRGHPGKAGNPSAGW